MKRLFLLALTAVLAMPCAANADIVTGTIDLRATEFTAGGVNTGGLAGGGLRAIANGDDALNLQITVTDTGSAAVFTSILTLSGTDGAGGSNIRALNPGIINVQGGSGAAVRQESWSVAVGAFNQTAGPAATISFDGFSSVVGSSVVTGGGFSVNGTPYRTGGSTETPPVNELTDTLSPFAQSGDVFTALGGNWRLDAINAQYTITTTGVPEPGSLALLGLGAVGMLVRRKR